MTLRQRGIRFILSILMVVAFYIRFGANAGTAVLYFILIWLVVEGYLEERKRKKQP